jgi:hypothetical protein
MKNRSCPYVEFDSKLIVSPNILSNFYYDKDIEIFYTNPKYDNEDSDEDDEDTTEWYYLINKVLKEIDGNANNFSDIVSFLTNNGKINV